MRTLILAVILFAVCIFPHELGHFIAARLCRVKVNEFAFGMGPALWKKQKGETLYAIRALPIGGYCMLEGEDGDSDDDRSFARQSVPAKIFILAAGAVMNILISILILTIVFTIVGNMTLCIGAVQKGSPAAEAGIRAGDRLVRAGGTEMKRWTDLGTVLKRHPEGFVLTVDRNGTEKSVRVVPKKESDGVYRIGVTCHLSRNPLLSLKNGTVGTWNYIRVIWTSLKMLVTGKVSAKDVSGPVGMVSIVHQSVSYGALYYLSLVAFISANLAVFNLLPLPALDGGRILLVVLRRLTGEMISDRVEGMINAGGFVLLMGLMVVVTFNDVLNLFN